jgi:hypothetical protein
VLRTVAQLCIRKVRSIDQSMASNSRSDSCHVTFMRMGRVIGFHVIGCTYGFWLPNDQRGSGSDYVRSEALRSFGPATRVNHSRSVAHQPFDPQLRRLARAALRYPYVEFSDAQIASVSRAFAQEIETYRGATVHALAILRNHFHFVCGFCRYDIRRFEGRLKGAATRQLLVDRIHPLQRFAQPDAPIPCCWSQKPWVVYCFDTGDMIRCINYVNDNMLHSRLAIQHHPFIIPYPGARPLPGASPLHPRKRPSEPHPT